MSSTGESDGDWARYSLTFTMPDLQSSLAAHHICLSVNYRFPADYRATGFQLEPGPVATPFEHRPIATEVSLCQRYYQEFADNTFYGTPILQVSNGDCACQIFYHEKRAIPTFTFEGTWIYREAGSPIDNRIATPAAGYGYGSTTNQTRISTGSSSVVSACWLEHGKLILDAEL